MRSLADDLRARTDEQLAHLLAARPDLLRPVPADVTALARQAGSPASIAACLRGYDQLTLHVTLAAALGPDPVGPGALTRTVAAALPGPGAPGRVRTAIHRLRADALLWGAKSLYLVSPARDLLVPADRGPRVAALDPVVAGYARDPQTLHELLGTAPPGVEPALNRLLAGPVVGTVADATRVPEADRSPVDWLLAHHLLVPLGVDRAVLAGEVVAILRRYPPDDPARMVVDLRQPAPARSAPDPARIDPGAVAAVLDLLHRCGELGRLWASAPPAKLRTGGISARDLTRTARSLSAPPSSAALLVEVATAAGLLAVDPRDQSAIAPTTAFDAWIARPPSEQAAVLLTSWLAMPRAVAGPEQRALGPDLAAPTAPDLRREVLRVLASAPGAWADGEVEAAVDWWTPRQHDATRAARVRAVLAQARELGLLVDGVLTSAGRAVDGSLAALTETLSRTLPEQVDELILQGDLTAIVPGLPTAELAELLRAMADSESVGAASTFRISAASIRRALDSGWSAAQLLAQLHRRAPVPQPLAYLIEDVARRHAVLRIGSAATFLRCEDPALLAGILADPSAALCGLVAVSDTVLISDQPADLVLEQLRSLGHYPLPEPGPGMTQPGAYRVRVSPEAADSGPTAATPALLAAAVRAIRANDRPGSSARAGALGRTGPGAPGAAGAGERGPDGPGPPAHPLPTMPAADVTAVLRAAIAAEGSVWIGYADPAGVSGERRVEPLRLAGGYLTALDARTQRITSFAVARISGAQPA